ARLSQGGRAWGSICADDAGRGPLGLRGPDLARPRTRPRPGRHDGEPRRRVLARVLEAPAPHAPRHRLLECPGRREVRHRFNRQPSGPRLARRRRARLQGRREALPPRRREPGADRTRAGGNEPVKLNLDLAYRVAEGAETEFIDAAEADTINRRIAAVLR